MKKLKIRKKKAIKLKKKGSELATKVGNVETVRVDEVEIERADVADKVVDELGRANIDVDVGEKGPPVKDMGFKESLSANPISKNKKLSCYFHPKPHSKRESPRRGGRI